MDLSDPDGWWGGQGGRCTLQGSTLLICNSVYITRAAVASEWNFQAEQGADRKPDPAAQVERELM